MNILTIDTCDLSVVGVVRHEDGGIALLSREVSKDSRHHAETITPMVNSALEKARITKPDAIIVGRGPGAFTGLRAGLVTARTLAFAWDIPLYGVSSLEAMAFEALDKHEEMLAVIDARRKELFTLHARREDGAPFIVCSGPDTIRPADIPHLWKDKDMEAVVVSKPGMYPELDGARVQLCEPEALAHLALTYMCSEEGREIIGTTEPLYLRRPDIAQGVAQPSGDGYLKD